jgi:hypothetical protein
MNPLQYQRAQAKPTAGNIAEAEKVVEKLGIAKSLARRYAKVEELVTIWRPSPKTEKPADGVFGHLKAKGDNKPSELQLPITTMTWEKFSRTVLPNAKSIELRIPSDRDNFAAIITAVHPDAPPILQWDREEQRNPCSSYVYNNGSHASHWGLVAGTYKKIIAICNFPHNWYGKSPNYPDGVVMVVEGARDLTCTGMALFPEMLKSELHGIRATIEAYSNAGKIEGAEEATACGLGLSAKSQLGYVVRVIADTGTQEYKLDRWD